MSKIILIDYADANGLAGAKVIAGPGITTDEQAEAIFEAARERDEFPKGFKRIEFFSLPESDSIAAHISDEVTAAKQNQFQARLKLQDAERARNAAERDAQKNFSAANKIYNAAANKRNAAIAAVAVPNNTLASPTCLEKDKPALLAQVEKLQPLADAATKEFNAVLEQFNLVRNPKATPEQKTAAYLALGGIEAPKTETK